MKLITETSFESNIIIEESTGKKFIFIEGKFLITDEVNKNGRIYPSAHLDPEVERYIKEDIMDNRGYGELNHPTHVSVNLERISHVIKSLKKEGNAWVGKAKLIDTPVGLVAQELVKEGCKLGISSRAIGDVKENSKGINEVQKNISLKAIDLVSSPSGPGCFVNGIMENVDFWFDDNKGVFVQEHVENTKKQLKTYTKKQIEEAKFRLFEEYINILVNKQ